jgi:putative transposase
MKQSLPQRKPLRLKSVDYSQNGAYFITICTENRAYLFGEIVGNVMVLNDVGRMVESVWEEMPLYYHDILLDAFVIMPNHLHFIVFIENAKPVDVVGDAPRGVPHEDVKTKHHGRKTTGEIVGNGTSSNGTPRGASPTEVLSLPDIVHRFKSLTTAKYRHNVKNKGWQPFEGKVWQRGYYDQIIRNEAHLNEVRQYITNNPTQWALDEENQINP